MIDINQKGLLYMTKAALPHLRAAAENSDRRVAFATYGVYNMTKFGVNGFSEALRQELAKAHVRVGVLELGGVTTELQEQNTPEVRADIDAVMATFEALEPEDIADGVAYMVTRPRHTAMIMPTDQG